MKRYLFGIIGLILALLSGLLLVNIYQALSSLMYIVPDNNISPVITSFYQPTIILLGLTLLGIVLGWIQLRRNKSLGVAAMVIHILGFVTSLMILTTYYII